MIDNKQLGTIDGFDITARIECDDIGIEFFGDESYTPEQVAAQRRGDWYYVGLIVTASRDDIELGSDSLWGIEYGDMPGVDEWLNPLNNMDDYEDIIDRAIEQARDTLAKLVAGASDKAHV